MSLWWASKEQLDPDQVNLIENLSLGGDYLVLGPPGSGKTNVLLRRAQFVRTQGLSNVVVLTFTRALTEFLKTGCAGPNGKEIFPTTLISTIERWTQEIYRAAGEEAPNHPDFATRKRLVAERALELAPRLRQPKLDVIFVDEAQDLIAEEVALIRTRGHRVFFAGDDKQKIYDIANGLLSIRQLPSPPEEKELEFHYRVAPEICSVADKILAPNGKTLSETCHYNGPKPGRVGVVVGDADTQCQKLTEALRLQLRVYADRIQEGDRLGIVVPTQNDREYVAERLEENSQLAGKWQIVRARSGAGDRHDPTLDPSRPILIMTELACKGLEFRAVHWLFVDEGAAYRSDERYYTVVTRAKTSLDLYAGGPMPAPLARAHAPTAGSMWT